MPLSFAAVVSALLAAGLPVFIALSLAVMAFIALTTATPPQLVIQRMFSGLDKFPLMAIPFFILAGNLMVSGGLSKRLIRLANALVGPLPGGLAMTTVLSAMFFSAISGSSPATVVAVGKLMLPAMTEAGYKRAFAVGLLMGAGSLGIVIPPSIFMIVYGAVTGVSIGALFLSGFGAGLIYGALFFAVAVVYSAWHRLPRASHWSWREVAAATRDAAWGLLIPVLILGGIYGGFFTPTEAAAVAVVYTAFVTLVVHGELDWGSFCRTLVDSGVTTAQVMIILAAAQAFAWYLTTSGLARELAGLTTAMGSDPLQVLLLINAMVLVAGMYLDPNAIVVILVPLLTAAAATAGIDPIHLGVVLAVNAAIGMFTPPFGLNLFVAGSLGVSYGEAIRGALPFVLVGVAALLLISLFPAVSLWLPAQVYRGVQ
ncbi:MAG: TRAP transporter large permease [Candidatus Competibacterales bacterium]